MLRRSVAAVLALGVLGGAVSAGASTGSRFDDVSARLIEAGNPWRTTGDDLEITFTHQGLASNRTGKHGLIKASADVTRTTTCGVPGLVFDVIVSGRPVLTAEAEPTTESRYDTQTSEDRESYWSWGSSDGTGRAVIFNDTMPAAVCDSLGTRAVQALESLPTGDPTGYYGSYLYWLNSYTFGLRQHSVEYRNATLEAEHGAYAAVPGGPWRYEVPLHLQSSLVADVDAPAAADAAAAVAEVLRPLADSIAALLQDDLCGADDPLAGECRVTVTLR